MKKWIILSGIVLVLVAAMVFLGRGDPLRSDERRAWKEKSISAIAARVADPAWPGNELTRLKGQYSGEPNATHWLSDDIIVMRNGEWLAYANICSKENRRIHDMFLARGSDGRWYYSTYHFCIRMIALQMNEQPGDLAGFVNTYYARTFDGRSDDCLEKTWPRISR